MTTIKLKLRPFTVPNFVIVEVPARPRQEGMQPVESTSIPLAAVSAEDLDAMCDEFRETVFKKAMKESGK